MQRLPGASCIRQLLPSNSAPPLQFLILCTFMFVLKGDDLFCSQSMVTSEFRCTIVMLLNTELYAAFHHNNNADNF